MSYARLSARELALNAAATAAISRLPDLNEKDISNLDDSCPICLLSFRSLLDGTAEEVLGESSMGLTKVEACGHIFCMNDLAEWIRGKHGTCPACRHPFLPELLTTGSDDESSDGGEYVPTEHEAESDMDTDLEDDRDGFFGSDGVDIETMDLESSDALSGVDSDIEEYEHANRHSVYVRRVVVDPDVHTDDEAWLDDASGDGEHEWGLTDGESMSASDDGIYPGEDGQRDTADIQVRLDSEGEYALEEPSATLPKSESPRQDP